MIVDSIDRHRAHVALELADLDSLIVAHEHAAAEFGARGHIQDAARMDTVAALFSLIDAELRRLQAGQPWLTTEAEAPPADPAAPTAAG